MSEISVDDSAVAVVVSVDVSIDDEAPDFQERWSIGNVAELDWAMKRLAEFRKMVAQNNAVEAANIARVKAVTQRLNESMAGDIAFFSGQIEQYVRANRLALIGSGKKKSRTFVHGTVAFRKSGGHPVITDKELLFQWAMSQPVEANVIRLKTELAWDTIKSMVEKTTGEIPPGVDIEPETESFKIEAIGDAANEH